MVIDVRSSEEVAQGTLKKAINIIHNDIAHATHKLPADKAQPIVVFCGDRAGMAVSSLQAMGYTNVVNAGGYSAIKHLDEQGSVPGKYANGSDACCYQR